MLAADWTRAGAVAALAVVAALGPARALWLLPIGAVFGAADGLSLPATFAIAPALLPADELQAGNALLSGGGQVVNLAGPAIGGAAVAFLGSARAFGVDAVSFVVSALTLVGVRRAMRGHQDTASPAAELRASGCRTPGLRQPARFAAGPARPRRRWRGTADASVPVAVRAHLAGDFAGLNGQQSGSGRLRRGGRAVAGARPPACRCPRLRHPARRLRRGCPSRHPGRWPGHPVPPAFSRRRTGVPSCRCFDRRCPVPAWHYYYCRGGACGYRVARGLCERLAVLRHQ